MLQLGLGAKPTVNLCLFVALVQVLGIKLELLTESKQN